MFAACLRTAPEARLVVGMAMPRRTWSFGGSHVIKPPPSKGVAVSGVLHLTASTQLLRVSLAFRTWEAIRPHSAKGLPTDGDTYLGICSPR
jgi:hypothetical protein